MSLRRPRGEAERGQGCGPEGDLHQHGDRDHWRFTGGCCGFSVVFSGSVGRWMSLCCNISGVELYLCDFMCIYEFMIYLLYIIYANYIKFHIWGQRVQCIVCLHMHMLSRIMCVYIHGIHIVPVGAYGSWFLLSPARWVGWTAWRWETRRKVSRAKNSARPPGKAPLRRGREMIENDSHIFKPHFIGIFFWKIGDLGPSSSLGPGFRCAWCAVAAGLIGSTGRCPGEFGAAQECLLFAINAAGWLVEVWRGFVSDPWSLGKHPTVVFPQKLGAPTPDIL